jgi:hypothetical protein
MSDSNRAVISDAEVMAALNGLGFHTWKYERFAAMKSALAAFLERRVPEVGRVQFFGKNEQIMAAENYANGFNACRERVLKGPS